MQLKAVGHVAVLGGLLQIAIFMFLCGITAAVCCLASDLVLLQFLFVVFLVKIDVKLGLFAYAAVMWSQIVRGSICWFLLINVINCSGILLHHFFGNRISLFILAAASGFLSGSCFSCYLC